MPGGGSGYMRQPMNKQSSNQNSLANINNANEKIAMMNRIKE